MRLILSLLLLLSPVRFRADLQEVTPLSFDAKEFLAAFNEAAPTPRLVAVFSPTCGHCLRAASDVQDILSRNPEAKLRVLILWAPYLRNDNRHAAQTAATYVSDSRVEHFWDLWRFGSRVYSEQFNYPVHETWDLFVVYARNTVWREGAPQPFKFFQNRNLDHGTPYEKAKLEATLKELIQ